mmetsp:Transcript_57830/g.122656  ORF Transcript_57830/g.122656 Transcript_57830/m.122656 type:complete len:368 (-) Transcript_57830:251-1354(-)
MRRMKVFHVVRALHVLDDVPPSGGSEGLDGKDFVLFHFGDVIGLNDGDRLSRVDLVGSYGVAIEISYALDRIRLPVQLHLVAFHYLLHRLPNVTQPHVDPGRLDSRVRRRLDSLQQWIVLGIERHRPRAVDDPPIDLRPEVHLHDVIVRQHGIVPAVGRVVRRHVVEAAPGGEPYSPLQPVLPYQFSICLLQSLAHFHELYPRLDERLRVVTDLPVHLGGVPQLGVEVGLEPLCLTKLGGRDTVGVGFQRVLLDLSLGEGREIIVAVFGVVLAAEEIDHGDGGRLCLAVGDVVIGEAPLVEHASLGLEGGSSLGGAPSAGGGRFLLFLLLLHGRRYGGGLDLRGRGDGGGGFREGRRTGGRGGGRRG